MHSVHPPSPPFLLGEGGEGAELPTKFSKRGGLDRTSALRGGCWKRGGNFFRGVAILQKNIKQN